MDNQKIDSPNYKDFLDSIEYDSTEVEKYFQKIRDNETENLEKIEKGRDERIASFYNDYIESIKIYDELKYGIYENYFKKYKQSNEDALLQLEHFENLHIQKRNEIIYEISKKENEINSAVLKNQTEFFEAKKEFQKNIEVISRKMDSEYEKHMEVILKAKENMLKNKDFFLLTDKHIEKLSKTIDFLEEYAKYHENIVNSNVESVTMNSKKLEVYIKYLDDLMQNLDEERKSLKEKFGGISESISEIEDRLFDNGSNFEIESNKTKSTIKHTFYKIDKAIKDTTTYFEGEIEKESNPKIKKSLKKMMNASIASLNSRKERLSLDIAIEDEMISRKNEITSSYIKTIGDLKSSLKREYENDIDKNTDNSLQYLRSLKSLIEDELNNVEIFNSRTTEARNKIFFLTKEFNELENGSKIESLKVYKDHLVSVRNGNKDMDVLAFEILTSEELLAMKLIDLRKEFLIADDQLEVDKLKYIYKINELKSTRNARLVLESLKNDIEVLRNELAKEKEIIKKNLETELVQLDSKKDLELLSIEYKIAYNRISNVEKIIDVQIENKPVIDTITSQIKLQEVTELVLLDAIGKKKDYDALIEKYEKDIEDLDYKCDERIRYMNNVLEIVKNNFDDKKKDVTDKAKALVKSYYPELRDIKKNAGRLIENTKKKFKNDTLALENRYNYENDSYNAHVSKHNEIITSFKDNVISNIDSKNLTVDTTGDIYSSIVSFTLNEIETAKKKFKANNDGEYFKNKIKASKDPNFIDLINKAVDSIKSDLKKTGSFKSESALSSLFKTFENHYNKDFKNLLSVNKPLTEKEKTKIKNEYIKQMNDQIAKIAIGTTVLETPSISSIYDINENRDKEIAEYEKSVNDYKDYYIEIMEKLKDDYNSRYTTISDALTELKNKNLYLNESMNKSIMNAYSTITSSNKEANDAYVLDLNNLKNNAKTKTNELNNDLKKKDEAYNQLVKETNKDSQDFANKLEESHNHFYNYFQEIKRLDRIAYDRKIKLLEDKKETEFKRISDKVVNIKSKYNKNKEDTVSSLESKRINNIIEYGTKNNELKNEILSIDSNLDSISSKFKSEAEKITKEIENEVDAVLSKIDSSLELTYKNLKENTLDNEI